MSYFQIRPIKRLVRNNEISTFRSDASEYGVCNKLSNLKKMLCYFTLHFKGGEFTTLTVFNCELTAKKNLLDVFFFFFFSRSCCLRVFLFIHSYLTVVITVKFTTQFSEKRVAFIVSAAVQFGVWASFLGYHCIEITP